MSKFEMPSYFIIDNDSEKDPRSDFANAIAQLLVDKYGSIDKALEKWEEFDEYLEEHVRNIYELDDEIPLKLLYNLTTNEWNDFDFDSVKHYNWAVAEIRKTCEKYYMTTKI